MNAESFVVLDGDGLAPAPGDHLVLVRGDNASEFAIAAAPSVLRFAGAGVVCSKTGHRPLPGFDGLSSVPGAFAPLKVSGSVLVDGLIFSNLPIDAAREAEHLVVNDITTPFKGSQDHANMGSVAMALIDVMIHQNTQRQLSLLKPDDITGPWLLSF
jgi:hypothetical protein